MPLPRLRPPALPPGFRAKVRELDERANGWFTPIVKWIVYLSVTLFVLTVIFRFQAWYDAFAASPYGTFGRARVWQLLTYSLLHDRTSIMHLLLNLLALWFFGIRLENAWGSTRFLRLCITTAAGAALVHISATAVFVSLGLMPPAAIASQLIGSSGIVYGVLTVYALLHPHDTIYVYGIVPVKARYLIIGVFVFSFLGSLSTRVGSQEAGNSHLGHLGGILFGWLFLRYPDIFDRIPVPRIGHRRWRPPAADTRPRWRPPR